MSCMSGDRDNKILKETVGRAYRRHVIKMREDIEENKRSKGIEILKKVFNDEFTFSFRLYNNVYTFQINENNGKFVSEYAINFNRQNIDLLYIFDKSFYNFDVEQPYDENYIHCFQEYLGIRLEELDDINEWLKDFYNEFIKATTTGSKTKPAKRNIDF